MYFVANDLKCGPGLVYEFPLVSSERALKGGKGEQSSSRTVYWAIGLTISGP